MAKRGKRYQAAAAKIDRDRRYRPTEAMRLVQETVTVNYDPTVELAVRLGVDPRKADQMLRGSVPLPHGVGKEARVAVFAEGDAATAAESAGADIVGAERVTELIESGELDVDAVIATPDQMGKIGRYGKTLGPRGLMPNPKSGTVTTDVATAVSEIKAGKVEYRTDRQGNVHLPIGKASFEVRQLVENYGAVIDELVRQRPSAAKGRYLRSIHVSTAQGPSVPVDPGIVRVSYQPQEEESVAA
ncbi:50S ribosomal protein L1 [Egibacter rhizosphaerae]|uniref:Large ribosomal subunit protein uL1 n=1 Tax=Egibacter rhizosphaerae TaxID=1670831 RepID=A0A411YGW0_9ACTN|nr:50S ribosomal protein L1 [Egibacter rhizosphaerae]QBI20443.1 50S ribosomal protein L1 [Egibacter rhizosphaerae]